MFRPVSRAGLTRAAEPWVGYVEQDLPCPRRLEARFRRWIAGAQGEHVIALAEDGARTPLKVD